MATISQDQNWAHPNSIEDEDQEEALSLCDLPTNNEDQHCDQSRTESAAAPQIQDDFDFGSWSSSSLLTQPDMCAADDVFFQGQILPLRHSISSASDSGLAKFRKDSSGYMNRFISRSMSMDHHHHSTSGNFSSRSSSIRSHNSASSGSASTTSTFPPPKGGSINYKPKLRNQFHSHPSPTPQIRVPNKTPTLTPNRKSSTMWRFFQVGLQRTPEIELKDLKIRNKNNSIHPFGSRNSNSSINSTSSSIANANAESNIEKSKKKKLHSGLFGISCKCSVDAIETVPLNIVIVNKNNREKDELLRRKTTTKKKKKKGKVEEENVQGGKQGMSSHRTFEWLKQLPLREEGASNGNGGGGGGGSTDLKHRDW